MVSAHFSSLNMLFLCIGLLFVDAPYVLCTASFSMELMHRDSPGSPLYDPTSNPSSRLDASIKRSASRADYLHSVNSRSPNSPLNLFELPDPHGILNAYESEYLITAHIGTPPTKVELVMNPGGSLIWIACDPCSCFETNSKPFKPRLSDTYRALKCTIKKCIEAGYKCDDMNKCEYTHSYTDTSSVTGLLSRETITLFDINKRKVNLEKMIFGCTHKTVGHFSERCLGFMGLGGGNFSFVRQLGLLGYQMKFSYCLPPSFAKPSRVYFGSSGSVESSITQITPIEVTNIYKVTVDSISVGGATHVVGDKYVMDAGTFLTYVDKDVLANLIRMVEEIADLPIIVVTPNSTFKLCYDVTNAGLVNRLPPITLNFADGAKFILKLENAFLSFPDQKAMCLAIVEKTSAEGYSIIGSLAQVHYRIGFDLMAKKLGFYSVNQCV